MNLEDQVCSLDLAKKLLELGVKQQSLFYHVARKDKLLDIGIRCFGIVFIDMFDFDNADYEYYSAFTAAELGEMLPYQFYDESSEEFSILLSGKDEEDRWFLVYSGLASSVGSKEADLRAEVLIKLIENKIIKGEKPC